MTRRLAAIALLLAVVTIIPYWQTVGFDFIGYDDPGYVRDNPHVRAGVTLDGVAWAFTTNAMSNWHPLTWLSHMLDCELFGLDAGRHHLVNVILHAANAVGLFLVLTAMTAATWPSAFAAALFALHPLHVESVAWIAERKDVLCALFWVLTLAAYVHYVRRPSTARYLVVALALIGGLLAKPMAVTLPFVLLLLDFWPFGRLTVAPSGSSRIDWSGARRLVWEKLPLFALVAAASTVTFLIQRGSGAVRSSEEISLGARVGNAVLAYVRYLGRTLWPIELACFYPLRLPLDWWHVAGAAVLLTAITIAVLRVGRRRPYVVVGWLWYVGTLVPVIGLVQVGAQAMADRYTYVPLIGLFIIVAWGARDLLAGSRTRSIALGAGAGMVLALCIALTWRQVGFWGDGLLLFEHALAVTTDNHIAHVSLGGELLGRGRPAEAIPHFEAALRIAPNFPEAHAYLTRALRDHGDPVQALEHAAQALRLRPNDAEAHSNFAAALQKQGRIAEALAHLDEALRLDPEFADAHYNRATVLTSAGRTDEAVAEFREALRLNPNHAEAHNNLGALMGRLGDRPAAIAAYREALRVRADYPAAHINLAGALRAEGKVDEARTHLAEALRIEPDRPEANYGLANLLVQEGQVAEAVEHYEAALRVQPNYPEARNNLGRALAAQGKLDQAIAQYAEALRINPRFAHAYFNRGLAYRARGDREAAEADLARARELDPRARE